MKIRFENENRSKCSIGGEPKWQTDLIDEISETCFESVKAANEALKKEVENIKAEPGYYGTALLGALKRIPRYEYIKNVEADGELYDVEIDLITRSVAFLKVPKSEE